MIARTRAALAALRTDIAHLRALPALLREGVIEVLSSDVQGRPVLLTRVLLSGDVIAQVDQRFAERTDEQAKAIARQHALELRAAVAPAAAMPAALARMVGRCATGVGTVSGLGTAGVGPASLTLSQLGALGALAGDLGAGLALGFGMRFAARGGLRQGARWWLRRAAARIGLAGPDAGRAAQRDAAP